MCYELRKREERQDRDEAFFLTAATALGVAVGLALVAAMLVSSVKKSMHEERLRTSDARVFQMFRPVYHVGGKA